MNRRTKYQLGYNIFYDKNDKVRARCESTADNNNQVLDEVIHRLLVMFTQTKPDLSADEPKMDNSVDPGRKESTISSEYKSSSSSSHCSNEIDDTECDDEVDDAKKKLCETTEL